MTIGELARRGGVGIETIRYYQRRGLMLKPPRRTKGFREYPDEALRTLRFIRRAKGLGFTLKETAGLLALRAGRGKVQTQLLDLVADKVAELERDLADLQVAIRALRRLMSQMADVAAEDRWGLFDPESATEP